MTDPPKKRFGFGSYVSDRLAFDINDSPPPGAYDQEPHFTKTLSIRGQTTGFTTFEKRKYLFGRHLKTPSPADYNPVIVDHHIKPRIRDRYSNSYKSPFQKTSQLAETPGPGSYDPKLTEKGARTAVFKSKVERKFVPEKAPPQPRYDGRAFYLQIN